MSAEPTAHPRSPFLDPGFQKDPYPTIHRLRREDPVHFVPELGCFFVTRYDDVRQLFTDPRVTNDRRAWEHYVPPPEGSFMRWVADNGLFALPPEEHARIRRLVSAAFTPRAVGRMESQIAEVVQRFAGPLQGRRGIVDLMAEFTDPIPNAVISRITGVPPAGDDEKRFRELAQTTIRGFFSFAGDDIVKQAEAAFLELADWVRTLARERRRRPQEDLVSDLVQIQQSDEGLCDDDIVILVTGLIGAGSETTALGGMIGLLTLLEHPDALERLREDRSLLPMAVGEILRFGFGGPGGLPRYALQDFELRGKKIRKGQMLMLSFGGANRDPSVYPDPDVFDIERNPKDLLVFGNGPHYCLGANLARTEMRCMMDAALDFLPPGARFCEERIELEKMGIFQRPKNLPIDFGE